MSREIIKIAVDDKGDLQYLVNEEVKPHEVIGALSIVKRLLEAQIVSDSLKETTKQA